MQPTDRNPNRQPRSRSRSVAGWRFAFVSAAATTLLFAGCRPNKRYDLIEAELRTRDKELCTTRAALDQARVINRAYEQQQGGPIPGSSPSQRITSAGGGGIYVRDIQLGRGTGGIDEDGVPGDEALMVIVVPRDEDSSAVKVPARALVAAWEVDSAGLKHSIGTWEVSAEHVRRTWRTGLFSSGYHITLPWQTFPTTERVRIAVRLTTTDGKALEADRDVTVKPVAGSGRSIPYPSTPVHPPAREPLLPGNIPPGVSPGLPRGVEELPPPQGLLPPMGR